MKSFAPLLLLGLAASAAAQDLYDTSTLRSFNFTFAQPNWETQLRANYVSQTEIPADLEVDGITYPDVGVRIRGNTSYTRLPQGSQKFSLNVSIDFTDPDLELMGYSALNLNNAFTDPTFTREVAYNNFAARYIPNGRSNHALVTINGENWGVYANVQQFNKDLLREYFEDEDGMRIKMANTPNGPGLQYVGTNPSNYSAYEIKDDGGLADPIGAHIAVCAAVDNGNLSDWRTIDEVFAVDPSIWSLALENLFTDDDSYTNKGADFVTYRDPIDGRTHLLQTDGNETWRENWSPTLNFNSNAKPVLSHVLSVPELRPRYMAHMRTLLEEFDWATIEPILNDHMDLIDAHVLADPKKLYTYQNFLDNFGTTTLNLPGGGPGGGTTVIGLETFVTAREALLRNHPEVSAPAPTIAWVEPSDATPGLLDTVYITAQVEDSISGLQGVVLWYRADRTAPYERTAMRDDGLSGDGLAGDGVFGAVLPVAANAGQTVSYYVAATASNTYGSMTFSPRQTEVDPLQIRYAFGQSGMRITEYMYSGSVAEFVEFTNTSGAPIDLTGWSFDDQSSVAGTFDLSAAGTVAAGDSVIVCNVDPAVFAAEWALTGVVILGPNIDAALGRNDGIHLFDSTGQEVGRLLYGDENFPGSYRARDASAQVCVDGLGADNIYLWSESSVGDAWGSFSAMSGDIGTPGSFVSVACPDLGTSYCAAVVNSTGAAAAMSASGTTVAAANDVTLHTTNLPLNTFGMFVNSQTQGSTPGAGGSQGTLCLGGAIGRHIGAGEIVNSGVTGEVSLALDLSSIPTPGGNVSVLAGETWNYQLWFRDINPTATSNYSDGYAITFE